jgi:hypothetical protein
MISLGNRNVYATHLGQQATKMLGLSKGKTATRIEIRQAARRVTNQNSIGFWASHLTYESTSPELA